MLVNKFLYSVIANNDISNLFRVKDTFLIPKDLPYLEFVKDCYTKHGKLPDVDTVESKFNIELFQNTESPQFWYDEIVTSYQNRVVEDSIVDAAKNKGKAIDIFQKAIISYNTDIDSSISTYSDSKRRIDDYNNRKATGGISYLSTGCPEYDNFSLGYKRSDLWTIGGREGIGKAEPLSNDILTERGFIKFGDIKVGDKVYGSDGNTQTVKAIYPQGKRNVYKVTFADKTFVLCDGNHLWSSENRYDREKGTGFKTRTTLNIMEDIYRNRSLFYRVPNTPCVCFSSSHTLPIDPYILGLLLGDGCLSKKYNTTYTSADQLPIDYISVHYDFTECTQKGKARTIRLKGISSSINSLGLFGTKSSTKFIPPSYLMSSVSHREQLLQGLIDSDGYIGKSGKVEFSVRSKSLRDGVTFLVRSLGGVAIESEIQKVGKLMYTVRFCFYPDSDIIPCKLTRKLDNYKPISKVANFGKIIRSIEFSHEEECQCISVSNKDHLYLTGKDFIVTHNTWLLLRMANWVDMYLTSNDIDRSILIVSGEMDAIELEERLDAMRCEISYNLLSRGDLSPTEERKYKRYLMGVDSRVVIVDSFDNLKDVQFLITVYNPIICFIDGSHLLASSYEWTDIARVTSTMKKITRNNKLPIINTTHLKSEKGKSATGGDIDDFAYTKGYTRDSDIAGVMFADDMMEIDYKFGIDWVKVRRGGRCQLIFQNDYDKTSADIVEVKQGVQVPINGGTATKTAFAPSPTARHRNGQKPSFDED